MNRIAIFCLLAIGCSRGPTTVRGPRVVMADSSGQSQLTLQQGALVGVPAPNSKTMFLDTSGSLTLMDSTGARSAIGGGGGDGVPTARAVSNSNITLSGTQTVDGVALNAGDRELAAGQTDATTDGIYVVASGAWARSSDAIASGLQVGITQGSLNAGTIWILTTQAPITIGTTALTFAQVSSGGFGADTSVPVNNSNNAPVTAARLITSLPTNTAGSETGKFAINLLNGGVQVNSFAINGPGMALDPGAVQTTYDLKFLFGGVESARVRASNAGNLDISSLNTANINLFSGIEGSRIAAIGNIGIQMQDAAFQMAQGPTTASANTLILNQTISGGGSGNSFVISGSTQINLLGALTFFNGTEINLRFTGTPLIKHNQAASGSNLPIFFRSGADFTPTATDTMVQLVLMGATANGAATAWYCTNH